MTEWHIDGYDFSTCTCEYGCPCQFNALPTHGHCHACAAFHAVTGHHGAVRLDGLSFGGLFAWPGAIHEGNGEALPLIDDRANPAQREALLKILSGQDTDPGATFFQVFSSMVTKVHAPQFREMHYAFDQGKGEAVFEVPGLVTARATPIRNPVTGARHQVRVSLAGGFEFTEADFVSGEVETQNAPIKLSWRKNHAHLARLNITGHGVVRA